MDRTVKEEMVLGHECMLWEYDDCYYLRVERDDGSAVIEVQFSKHGELLPPEEFISIDKHPTTKKHFMWVIWAQNLIEKKA